jgi:hypothetical protein
VKRVRSVAAAAALCAGLFTATWAAPAGAEGTADPVTANVTAGQWVAIDVFLEEIRVSDTIETPFDAAAFENGVLDPAYPDCPFDFSLLLSQALRSEVSGCEFVSGHWRANYEGVTFTVTADGLDAVAARMVTLREAWQSGADAWTDEQRFRFAHDIPSFPDIFVGTTAFVDERGDSDPSAWMPSWPPGRCKYLADWLSAKYRWGLAVDASERDALRRLAEPCGSFGLWVPRVQDVPGASRDAGVWVYRYWNEDFGAHFYTADPVERAFLYSYRDRDWQPEGKAFRAFSAPATDTVPVHRFWSERLRAHFFTADPEERARVEEAWPGTWAYEGIAFYAYPADTEHQAEAVHRFWSTPYENHFFTADDSEATEVRRLWPREWTYERIAFRVPWVSQYS